MTEEVRIYHRHLRALGYCNRQLKVWLSDRGVLWDDFLKNGASAAWARTTGDSLAIAAAESAEREVI